MTNPEDAVPFGMRVYDAVKAAGRLKILTARLDDAGIQELERASREEACELLEGAPDRLLELMGAVTPAELTAYVQGFADGRAHQANRDALWIALFAIT